MRTAKKPDQEAPPADPVVAIPSPQLADLDKTAAALDAAVVSPRDQDQPAGSGEAQIPSVIDAAILDKTLRIIGDRFPVVAFSDSERGLLAEVWQKPLDGLYQRALAWLNTDPTNAGPWAQAVTVTLALLAPRIVPRLVDRFLPGGQAATPDDAATRSQ